MRLRGSLCVGGGAFESVRVVRRFLWAEKSGFSSRVSDAADATLDDLVQAEALLDDTYTRFRRIMGGGHPDTPRIHGSILETREGLARAGASPHA